MANPPEPPKIDWALYKKFVPVPGLVDKFKSEYEKFKIPVPKDNLSATVDKQWQTLQPEIKSYCEKMKKEIDIASKELARIKSLPKFDDMTMEMFATIYPDLAINPVEKPTFWPHTPDEQLGYKPPEPKVGKK